jgi:N-acetylglucosaminyldiphosphoundecaprenol N-acetyl-beta-D-mannosaminyltransferase
MDIINQSSLSTIDGAGIIKALQFKGHAMSLQDRLTGVRLAEILFDIASRHDYKIMVVLWSRGLTSGDELKKKLSQSYPELTFFITDEKSAITMSYIAQPDIIMVALGAPFQDIWIAENINRIPSVKIALGVGGAFDFMTKVRRAPKIMRSMGLEWLWRLLQQPKRIRRMYRAVIVFPLLVIFDKYTKK